MASGKTTKSVPSTKAACDTPAIGLFVVTSENLWTALALVFVIEGLLPFLSPQGWRRAVSQIAQLQDGQIRFFAVLAILSGLAMLWF